MRKNPRSIGRESTRFADKPDVERLQRAPAKSSPGSTKTDVPNGSRKIYVDKGLEIKLREELMEMERGLSLIEEHLGPTLNAMFTELGVPDAKGKTESLLQAADEFGVSLMPGTVAKLGGEKIAEVQGDLILRGYKIVQSVAEFKLGRATVDALNSVDEYNVAEVAAGNAVRLGMDSYYTDGEGQLLDQVTGQLTIGSAMPIGAGKRTRATRGTDPDDDEDRDGHYTSARSFSASQRETEAYKKSRSEANVSHFSVTGCLGKALSLADSCDVVYRWTQGLPGLSGVTGVAGSYKHYVMEAMERVGHYKINPETTERVLFLTRAMDQGEFVEIEKGKQRRVPTQYDIDKIKYLENNAKRHAMLNVLGGLANGVYLSCSHYEHLVSRNGNPFSGKDLEDAIMDSDRFRMEQDQLNQAHKRSDYARTLFGKLHSTRNANFAVAESLIADGRSVEAAKLYTQFAFDAHKRFTAAKKEYNSPDMNQKEFSILLRSMVAKEKRDVGVLFPAALENGLDGQEDIDPERAADVARSLAKLFDNEYRSVAGIDSPITDMMTKLSHISVSIFEAKDVVNEAQAENASKIKQGVGLLYETTKGIRLFNFARKLLNFIILGSGTDLQVIDKILFYLPYVRGKGDQMVSQLMGQVEEIGKRIPGSETVIDGLGFFDYGGMVLQKITDKLYDYFVNYASSVLLGSMAASFGINNTGLFTNPETAAQKLEQLANGRAIANGTLAKIIGVVAKVAYLFKVVDAIKFLGTATIQFTSRGGAFKVVIDALLAVIEHGIGAISWVCLPWSASQEQHKVFRANLRSKFTFLDDSKALAGFGFGIISYSLQMITLISEICTFCTICSSMIAATTALMPVGLVMSGLIIAVVAARQSLPGLTDMFSIFGQIICEHPEFGLFGIQMLRLLITGQISTVLFGQVDLSNLKKFTDKLFTTVRSVDRTVASINVVGSDTNSTQFLMSTLTNYAMDRVMKRDLLLAAFMKDLSFVPTTETMRRAIDANVHSDVNIGGGGGGGGGESAVEGWK